MRALPRALALGAWLLLAVAAGGAEPTAGARDPEPVSDAAPERPQVRLRTSLGTIDVELFAAEAPKTVANFLARVEEGFYDGLIFHRVIAGFMIQTGGYTEALDYREAPVQVPSEAANGLRNRRWTLAMARQPDDPDSASTQFFINVANNRHLDRGRGKPGFTVFGRVIAGQNTVVEIELQDTEPKDDLTALPARAVTIIEAKRLQTATPAAGSP